MVRVTTIRNAAAALCAGAGTMLLGGGAFADQPHPWQLGLQDPATPITQRIHEFHNWLLIVIFAISAVVFGLLTLAWGLNSLFSSLWYGFAVVFILLLLLTAGAFLFAWRKLKVGAPTPDLAIEEAKKIRATVEADL